jgi:hypothetical protein
MRYTLVMKNGKIVQFHLLEVAKLYLSIYGGCLITPEVLSTMDATPVA